MSDALCGPSNPLQQFKQQTQFDRTLQQDRLTSRQSPAQGFRSANPNASLLDPEFEAFQAGVPVSDLPQFHQRPPQIAGPSQAPSWATDFQRMQISPPPTFQQQQHAFQAGPTTPNWGNGFREHIAQTTPRPQQAAPSPQAFQYMARYGSNGFQNNYAQPNFATNVRSKGKETVTEQFDEAAFERAFDQARQDMMGETEQMETDEAAYQTGASTGIHEDMLADQGMVSQEQGAIHHMEHMPPPSLERLESDPIAEEMLREEVETFTEVEAEKVDEDKQQEDDDALALTAQELLEKVEHNKTDKFRNSQFLSLMRKLRDREVKVEGDKMVETSSGAATATENTSETMSAQPQHFNNSEQTPQIQPPIDAFQFDKDSRIPTEEQDHDAGRFNPTDGQAVVDLLNQPPMDASPDDIGTSSAASAFHPPSHISERVFYGDLRPRRESASEKDRFSHSLDGPGRWSNTDWKRWDLYKRDLRSYQDAEAAPWLQ